MYQIYQQSPNSSWEVNEIEFARLCRDVAAHMGKWQYQSTEHGNHCLVFDRYKLFLSTEARPNKSERSNPKIQISICGDLKEAAQHQNKNIWSLLERRQREAHTTCISVSVSRGPAVIAQEIDRRLVGDYIKMYQLALEAYYKQAKVLRDRLELTVNLAAILGAQPSYNDSCKIAETVSIGDCKVGVNAEISSSNYLTLSSVPADLMADILHLIAERAA